jgi:hypothetical protein
LRKAKPDSTQCSYLDSMGITMGNGGVFYGRSQNVVECDKEIIRLCMEKCPFAECIVKVKDDKRERKRSLCSVSSV